ncbi:MAG: NAD(P)-dependent dehydrogenase (short-subunit alcohol dehydrogenase family) [Alphaproteobacteria bacterium]|jgi:NAD(P)-dependent dehydrogenase (short-subunit alcohol dehydrogenase family)
MSFKNIAILGASGAIGQALTQQAALSYPDATIHAFSRSGNQTAQHHDRIMHYPLNYDCETALDNAAKMASSTMPLDLVIIAIGVLHTDHIMPEKSLKDLSQEKFAHIFHVNTILPALIAKHFTPKLNKNTQSIFAALSARVGSISDNNLGGWYAYRASKAALNMILKNTALEISRKNSQAVIVGLHPGTVASTLSKPFEKNVQAHKLFTPDYSATQLLSVINQLSPSDTGKIFAWDGQEIQP